jgi:DNA-binding GntR family transcriptional regulator
VVPMPRRDSGMPVTPMTPFAVAKIVPAVSKNVQAYEQLKQALLYATFRAGDVLSLRGLADLLGTSTMPVREAVTRLVAERALEALPNRGVHVPVLTPYQARDIFRMRITLEPMAAELAASVITDAELEQLELYQRQFVDALQRQQVQEAVRANIQFHLSLSRASRSETIIAFIETLYLRVAPSLYTVVEKLPSPTSAFVEAHHNPILAALRSRDGPRTRAAIEVDMGPWTIGSDAVGCLDAHG